MSTEQNKAITRAMIDAWNSGDRASWANTMADDLSMHLGDGTTLDAEEARGFMEMLQGAMSNHTLEIHHMIAEGDLVAVVMTDSATMTGGLMGMEPTGESFSIPAIEVYRFVDGKIAESWEGRDMGELMRQLGVTPPEAPAE